jgi:hypothetical protein
MKEREGGRERGRERGREKDKMTVERVFFCLLCIVVGNGRFRVGGK